ncbi:MULTISPECIES: hypothetical protein [unclassified Streptomyces]
MAAFGTGQAVAHEGALLPRGVGTHPPLLSVRIVYGGVFEGGDGRPGCR